jgi:hypothetical protein
MKRLATLRALLILPVVLACGCASNAGNDIYKRQIALLEEQADAIEADAPKETRDGIRARQAEVQKEFDALGLSKRQKVRLHEDNKEAFRRAEKRLLAATKTHLEKALEQGKGILGKDKGK